MSIHNVNFRFDFSIPDRITWSWRGHGKQVDVPEDRVMFLLNDDSVARVLMSAVDPILADLVNVSVSVHLADRLALREKWISGRPVQCCRNLELTIPVDNLAVWSDPTVHTQLDRVLSFLSHDKWSFTFVRRAHRRTSEAQQFLFERKGDREPIVSLFSGGLDSFAGTAIQMAQNPCRQFIAVSASPTNIHLGRQRIQFHALCNAFQLEGTHVVYQYAMRGAAKTLQEPTRRTRAFAFLVLGAVTAVTAGADQLYVHENGFGAINIPYDSSQVGVDMTRAMHPTNLANVAELLSVIMAKDFSIVNDCVFYTKGEMCGHDSVRSVAKDLVHTFSCDGMTHAGFHCGYCTSCLLRRVSLEVAGLRPYDCVKYLHDLTLPSHSRKPRHLRGLTSMTWQAMRLRRCLAAKSPWNALSREFPEVQLAAAELARTNPEATDRLCRLYEQHVNQWLSFSAVGQLATSAVA
jgi:7-cyano-7-deazaguanine synthase in queuosine biosynthesis